jgi:hypothetical protein
VLLRGFETFPVWCRRGGRGVGVVVDLFEPFTAVLELGEEVLSDALEPFKVTVCQVGSREREREDRFEMPRHEEISGHVQLRERSRAPSKSRE